MESVNFAGIRYPEHGSYKMEDDLKFGLTRRQFLKGNILLVIVLAFSKFPFKVIKDAFRNRNRPNLSDKEARFYSNLAG